MSVAEFKPLPASLHDATPRAQVVGSVIDLRGVGQVLKRRRMLIVLPALALGLAAALVALVLPPRFVASTQIIFDPRPMQVLQNDLQIQTLSGEETGAEAESQLQVITSAEVLDIVIDQLGLDRDPDFGSQTPTLVDRTAKALAGLLHLPAPKPVDTRATALRQLQQDIAVDRLDRTYILDIKVQTPSAQKSAAVANAVASAFLKVTVQNRAAAVRRSGDALSARLDELRMRLARSEEAVESYRNKHNLVGANGKPVIEQQMTDVSNQLTLARARRAEQQARVESIDRSLKNGSSLDAVPEANTSPVLTVLKEQLAAAQRQEIESRLTFGDRHPDRIAALAQLGAARRRLDAEIARLAGSARTDSDRAKTSVALMAQHLDALKSADATVNDDLVKLRELEREATSDRSVYEAFLNRAKELQQRQSLDTLDARVLTPAVTPIYGSGPSRLGIVLAGAVLGGLLGIGAALVREQFDDTIRSPLQIAAETTLPVLAVIRNPADPDDAGLWALRNDLEAGPRTRQARHVLLAGIGDTALCGMVACQLARTAEYETYGTLLVDADDERRDLTRRLQAEAGDRGEAFTVAPTARPREALRVVNGIPFVPATSVARNYVRSPQDVRASLDTLVQNTRLVLLYAGALGAASSRIRALGAAVDEIVLVVEAGKAHMSDLTTAVQVLGSGSNRLRGLVVVGKVDAV